MFDILGFYRCDSYESIAPVKFCSLCIIKTKLSTKSLVVYTSMESTNLYVEITCH